MASWLLTGVAFAEQSNAALLTIDAQRDSTLHEPVQIDVTIVNLTKEPIVFKLGQDRDLKWAMSFTVTDPFGDVPVRPLIVSPDDLAIARIPHGTPESLAPGDSFHWTVRLNEWNDLCVEGQYRIAAHLADKALVTKQGQPVEVSPSNTLVFDVGPRDEARLRPLCANLAQQARAFSTTLAGVDAANTLSYIDDPVAVPFLDQLLGSEEPHISRSALKGLIRIGNDGAIDAMIRNLNVVRDSALKKTIIEALTTKEAEARNNRQRKARIHAALAKREKGVSEW
jgi:hypothetical protein